MAFALVASVEQSGGVNGGTSSGIDTSGADLITLGAGWYNVATADLTVSDSKGNSYTPLTKKTVSVLSGRQYYCPNPVVGSGHTFTSSGPTTASSFRAGAWSGSSGATPFDVENGATATTASTISAGSITPSADNCLVVAGVVFEDNSAGAVSINGGFTITQTSAYSAGVNEGGSQAYLIQTSSAAANPQWNITNNAAQLCAMISSYTAAAGGATAILRHPGMGAMLGNFHPGYDGGCNA